MTDKKGLYIHVPFCRRRCNYCDFTSYADKYGLVSDYFDKVISEIKSHKKYSVDTIYFGGGTPSSVDSEFIGKVLDAAYYHFDVINDAEITIEVNPDSADAQKLKAYKSMGINRISMGAQSFCDDELKMLGRLHNSDLIGEKYNLIRSVGFDNVSLDLMFGLPGQSVKKLQYSIDSILSLSPEHISCYGLKVEEGTPFYADLTCGKFSPLDEDGFADLYEYMCNSLVAAGYVQYEISNFCIKGRQSRHNSRYWKCHEYIGVGAGASSYLDGVRSKNTSPLLTYHNEVEEILSPVDKMSEFMILGLRMTDEGVSIKEFQDRFGADVYDIFGKQLKKYSRFITLDGDVLKLTKEAYYISNAVLSEFLL